MSRSNTRSQQRAVIIGFLVFASLPVIFGRAALHSHDVATALRDHGRTATATVTGSEFPYRGKDYLLVSFTTGDGRRISTRLYDFYTYDRPDVGEKVVVRYALEDPKDYIQDARQSPDFMDALVWGTCTALTGVITIAIMVAAWRTRLRAGRAAPYAAGR
ncbi:DUF3592 domain-containing protein [Actinomadura sp. HBU206391]|uniref:DUF3592 domain-containing protein n=1 Tax=Actinomadura sp. HBU206391 TaxID=2731692 RepID=UPI00164EF201|nr:DUF3592 domain-containing protein [Actinomadura sp. HBU206391]MBC6456549.1 hypothetical protein [Actinomadura sp. HBU206391]